MRITPEKSAPTPARILARANQMAETAEEAEMRELEEGVARLNDAGAPLLEAPAQWNRCCVLGCVSTLARLASWSHACSNLSVTM